MILKRRRFLIFVFSLGSLVSHIHPTSYGIENRCQMPKISPFFLLYSQIFPSIFKILTKYYYYTLTYTLTFLTLLSILSHFSHLPIFHFLYSLSILSPLLKFWYARLTIDNVTSLSPNHRHSHMPPPSTLTFT
jgi:hypothetical protein